MGPQTGRHGTEQSSDSQQQQQEQQQELKFQRQHQYLLQPPVIRHLQTAGAAALVPMMPANAMTPEEMKEWAKAQTKGTQLDEKMVQAYEEANPWLKNQARAAFLRKDAQTEGTQKKSALDTDCSVIADAGKRAKCERVQKTRVLEESIPVEDGWKVKLYK